MIAVKRTMFYRFGLHLDYMYKVFLLSNASTLTFELEKQ
jgi:hypothetical protein